MADVDGTVSGGEPVLQRGDEGPWIEYLERVLRYRGFYPGLIDGEFDEQLEQAVVAFQHEQSLTEDGQVGEQTWWALVNSPDGESDGGAADDDVYTRIDVTRFEGTTRIADMPETEEGIEHYLEYIDIDLRSFRPDDVPDDGEREAQYTLDRTGERCYEDFRFWWETHWDERRRVEKLVVGDFTRQDLRDAVEALDYYHRILEQFEDCLEHAQKRDAADKVHKEMDRVLYEKRELDRWLEKAPEG